MQWASQATSGHSGTQLQHGASDQPDRHSQNHGGNRCVASFVSRESIRASPLQPGATDLHVSRNYPNIFLPRKFYEALPAANVFVATLFILGGVLIGLGHKPTVGCLVIRATHRSRKPFRSPAGRAAPCETESQANALRCRLSAKKGTFTRDGLGGAISLELLLESEVIVVPHFPHLFLRERTLLNFAVGPVSFHGWIDFIRLGYLYFDDIADLQFLVFPSKVFRITLCSGMRQPMSI